MRDNRNYLYKRYFRNRFLKNIALKFNTMTFIVQTINKGSTREEETNINKIKKN